MNKVVPVFFWKQYSISMLKGEIDTYDRKET